MKKKTKEKASFEENDLIKMGKFDEWLSNAVFKKAETMGMYNDTMEPVLFSLAAFMFTSEINTQEELDRAVPALFGYLMDLIQSYVESKGLLLCPTCAENKQNGDNITPGHTDHSHTMFGKKRPDLMN